MFCDQARPTRLLADPEPRSVFNVVTHLRLDDSLTVQVRFGVYGLHIWFQEARQWWLNVDLLLLLTLRKRLKQNTCWCLERLRVCPCGLEGWALKQVTTHSFDADEDDADDGHVETNHD